MVYDLSVPTSFMRSLLIIGAGETARLCHEYFSSESTYNVVAFAVTVNDPNQPQQLSGIPVVSLSEATTLYPPSAYDAFVAVAATQMNTLRSRLFTDVRNLGYHCPSFISPRAYVSSSAHIGSNCLILENNTIQSNVTILDNTFIWSGNHIGHSSTLHENCFISSHCVIAGFTTIENNCFIGINSTIEDGSVIGKYSFVGASALIRGATAPYSVFQHESTKPSKVDSARLFRFDRHGL